jgi:hypothetical protein
MIRGRSDERRSIMELNVYANRVTVDTLPQSKRLLEVTLDDVEIRDEEVDNVIEVLGGVEIVLDHIGKDVAVEHFDIEIDVFERSRRRE